MKVPVLCPFMRRVNRPSQFGVLFLFSVVTATTPGLQAASLASRHSRKICLSMSIISHGADLLCIQASQNQRHFVSVMKTVRYDINDASKNYSALHVHSGKKKSQSCSDISI